MVRYPRLLSCGPGALITPSHHHPDVSTWSILLLHRAALDILWRGAVHDAPCPEAVVYLFSSTQATMISPASGDRTTRAGI
jgi:hypothetical protein